uniref:Myb-like domain-containing protein n=1 Tax=Timspurckia oligopyrenoides TaxID=708627 RepID=A0A7S0ZJ79_9RHOD|mmetsp:Transcript_6750/g.12073  ORF Transcript_6750/g.12073 Transcript_6750/m.12073 type:complete len:279 (+) Transcript_6750:343-1179(+)
MFGINKRMEAREHGAVMEPEYQPNLEFPNTKCLSKDNRNRGSMSRSFLRDTSVGLSELISPFNTLPQRLPPTDYSSQREPSPVNINDTETKRRTISSNLGRVSVSQLLCVPPVSNLAENEEKVHSERQEQEQTEKQQEKCIVLESRRSRVRQHAFNASTWSAQEDELILSLAEKYGKKGWNIMSRIYFNGKRTGSQLRSRYMGVINPNRNRKPWSMEEDREIVALQHRLGNRWSEISKHFDRRLPNDVKNRFRDLTKSIQRINHSSDARRNDSDERKD